MGIYVFEYRHRKLEQFHRPWYLNAGEAPSRRGQVKCLLAMDLLQPIALGYRIEMQAIFPHRLAFPHDLNMARRAFPARLRSPTGEFRDLNDGERP